MAPPIAQISRHEAQASEYFQREELRRERARHYLALALPLAALVLAVVGVLLILR